MSTLDQLRKVRDELQALIYTVDTSMCYIRSLEERLSIVVGDYRKLLKEKRSKDEAI